MIIIRNTKEEIFGGFFSHQLEISNSFYGSGTSFLFSIINDEVWIFKSSTLNSFYCFLDATGFGFGQEEHYGLFIDKTLQKGSTYFCKTYLNDPLCS